MRMTLAMCAGVLLCAWVLVVWGIIANVRPAIDFADVMESTSGLGSWFRPLFILVFPVALVVLYGLLIPQRKTKLK
jgi:NADH:ubiquinone oxidoreductase subunit 6 (subunit J)